MPLATTVTLMTLLLAPAAAPNMAGKWIIDGDVQCNQGSRACVV